MFFFTILFRNPVQDVFKNTTGLGREIVKLYTMFETKDPAIRILCSLAHGVLGFGLEKTCRQRVSILFVAIREIHGNEFIFRNEKYLRRAPVWGYN